MYLNRTKRVAGLVAQDYINFDNEIVFYNTEDNHTVNLSQVVGFKELQSEIHNVNPDFNWKTIFYEAGYWRKANQIHTWFVKNIQDNNDDCGTYEVTKEKLEELLGIVNEILTVPNENSDLIGQYNNIISPTFDRAKAEKLLPTASGFFFGDTAYNEGYYYDLKLTRDILEKTLKETDFDKQIVFYHSSW